MRGSVDKAGLLWCDLEHKKDAIAYAPDAPLCLDSSSCSRPVFSGTRLALSGGRLDPMLSDPQNLNSKLRD